MSDKKPRIIETHSNKKEDDSSKKPKVLEERDYSLMMEKEREPQNILIDKPKKEEVESAREKLREHALADITPIRAPLEETELKRKIDDDQRKRNTLGKKLKRFVGLE